MTYTAEMYTEINTIEGTEFVDVAVTYSVEGKYIPATHYEPAEYPEVNIEWICDSEGNVIEMSTLGQGRISKIEEYCLENYQDHHSDGPEDYDYSENR